MDELVVVDVAASSDSSPRWTIDATGQFGTFIAEDVITDRDQNALTVDAQTTVERVNAFLTRCTPAVIDVLRAASAGDTPGH